MNAQRFLPVCLAASNITQAWCLCFADLDSTTLGKAHKCIALECRSESLVGTTLPGHLRAQAARGVETLTVPGFPARASLIGRAQRNPYLKSYSKDGQFKATLPLSYSQSWSRPTSSQASVTSTVQPGTAEQGTGFGGSGTRVQP